MVQKYPAWSLAEASQYCRKDALNMRIKIRTSFSATQCQWLFGHSRFFFNFLTVNDSGQMSAFQSMPCATRWQTGYIYDADISNLENTLKWSGNAVQWTCGAQGLIWEANMTLTPLGFHHHASSATIDIVHTAVLPMVVLFSIIDAIASRWRKRQQLSKI